MRSARRWCGGGALLGAMLLLAAVQSASAAASAYRVMVTNEFSGDLSVIDGSTHRLISTVALGKRPRGVRVSPDGHWLYIALSGSPIAGPGVDESKLPPADKQADGIGVFDVRKLALTRIIKGVSDPEQLAVTRDGRTLIVASEDTASAVLLDVASGAVLATLPTGAEPEGVNVSPNGTLACMTAEGGASVAMIDLKQRTLERHITVGQRPRNCLFDATSRRLYVSNEFGGSVSELDVHAGSVLRTVTLPGEGLRPMGLAFSHDGARLFVTTGRGNRVVVLSSATLAPSGSIEVGQRPWGLALSPDGRELYTADGLSNQVTIIEARSLSIVGHIAVGQRPWGVAIVR
jgi:YVTN family beta-propeller protein